MGADSEQDSGTAHVQQMHCCDAQDLRLLQDIADFWMHWLGCGGVLGANLVRDSVGGVDCHRLQCDTRSPVVLPGVQQSDNQRTILLRHLYNFLWMNELLSWMIKKSVQLSMWCFSLAGASVPFGGPDLRVEFIIDVALAVAVMTTIEGTVEAMETKDTTTVE